MCTPNPYTDYVPLGEAGDRGGVFEQAGNRASESEVRERGDWWMQGRKNTPSVCENDPWRQAEAGKPLQVHSCGGREAFAHTNRRRRKEEEEERER